MAGHLSDFACKALINEGQSLDGKNSKQVVKELRSTPQGKTRLFIFTDPETGRIAIWRPEDKEPSLIEKQDLNKLLLQPDNKRICVFYFGPPDTRGTDYKIPPGYGVLSTGASTNNESFMQAAWRERGLGERHGLKFLTTQGVVDRLLSEMPSIQMVAKLRLQPENAGKTFVYWNPFDKKLYEWKPDADKPNPIETEKLKKALKEDRGQLTRKTNKGENSKYRFYVRAKDDMRLYQMAKDNDIAVISPSPTLLPPNSKELTSLKGLPAVISETLSFDELYDDIKRVSIQQQKGLVLKATFHKMETIVSVGIRNLIYNPMASLARDDKYWDPKEPVRRLIDSYINSHLNRATRSLYIKSKEVNFDVDVNPTQMQALEDKAKDKFAQERAKLDKIKKELLSPLGLTQIFGMALKTEDKEHMQNRVREISSQLKELGEQLDEAEKTFTLQIDEHKKYMASFIPTSGGDMPGSLEEVQEVEQQLEQQQEQQQEQQLQQQQETGVQDANYTRYKYQAWDPLFELDFEDRPTVPDHFCEKSKAPVMVNVPGLMGRMATFPPVQPDPIKLLTPIGQQAPECGFDQDLLLSPDMANIVKQMSSYKGDPLGHIYVASGPKGKLSVMLISREDYHSCVAPRLKKQEKASVYTLLNGAQFEEGCSLVEQGITSITEDELKKNHVMQRIVQAKWLLGYSTFSKTEEKELADWISNLKDDQFNNLALRTTEKGNPGQQRLIQQLRKKP